MCKRGSATITNSTISGNRAQFDGGGVYSSDQSLQIADSTLSGNIAGSDDEGTGSGGGILDNAASSSIEDSTIANNSAGYYGGGIAALDNLTITDSTISGNTAACDEHAQNDSTAYGGGIYGEASLSGTIVAGNICSLTDEEQDLAGTSFTGIDNLIGDGSGNLSPLDGNLTGDAMLAPLGFYGGPTETMPPLPGSPALHRGGTFDGVDQRGFGNDSPPDIGAFQTQPVAAGTTGTFAVNTTADSAPVGEGQMSLLDAVNLADALGDSPAITFDPSLWADEPVSVGFADSCTLDGSLLVPGEISLQTTGAFSIDGSLTISGAVTNDGTLTVANGNLTVDNNDVSSGGTLSPPVPPYPVNGELANNGTLSVVDSGFGVNGILVNAGTLTATASPLGLGGILDLDGTSLTINGLAGNGLITNNGSAAAVLTLSTLSIGFGGSIDNGVSPIALVVPTAADAYISGVSTFSGGTTIDGTVWLESSGNLGTSGVHIGGGQLLFYGSTVSLGNPISGGGTVRVVGGQPTLTGSNTYSGQTYVDEGTLFVDNTSGSGTGSSDVTVDQGYAEYPNSASTLGGTGTISGSVTIDGPGSAISIYAVGCTLAPGIGYGPSDTLTIQQNLIMEPGSILNATIDGSSAGDYSQVKVDGTVTVTGANLNLSSSSSSYADYFGIPLTIIQNEGGEAVNGTFNGLTESYFAVLNNEGYEISYMGGGAHNVTLTQGPLWIGATSGSNNIPSHQYDNTANWANGVVDGSFDDVDFTDATTLYVGANAGNDSTDSAGLNYFGNSSLTFESSTSSTAMLTLAGNVSGGYPSTTDTQTVTLGNPDAPLNLSLGESALNFNLASGDNLFAQNAIEDGTLTESGNGTLGTEDGGGMSLTALNVDGGTLSIGGSGSVGITTANVLGGTLSIGVANALYGTTVDVEGGTLSMGAADALSGTNLSISSGIFDLNGTDQTVTGLSRTGGMIVNNHVGPRVTLTDSGGSTAGTTYSGTIADNSTGSGGTLALALTDTPFLTLSGNNSYSGGTTIYSGDLYLNENSIVAAGSGTIENDGFLVFNQSGGLTFTNDIIGSGQIAQNGHGTTTYTGACSDDGNLIDGGGTFLVDGSLSSAAMYVVVSQAGVLGGSGFIASSIVIEAGGTLAPGDGNSPGTLTVTGSLSVSGSYLEETIDGTSAGVGYSQLDASGTVDITATDLNLVGSFTDPDGISLTILNYTGSTTPLVTFNRGTAAPLDGIWYNVNTASGTDGEDVVISYSPVVTSDGQLIVTASGSGDSVTVSENTANSTLSIDYDGQDFTDPVPVNGLFIYTRGGNDTITIGSGGSSFVCPTTVETINTSGSVSIVNDGSNVIVWDDPRDHVAGTGTTIIQTVPAFAGGVSMAVGDSLPDPTDIGEFYQHEAPLWGDGPAVTDVNQQSLGDCYFMATLAAFAQEKTAQLQDSAVDMGDGTYVVEYWYQGITPVYVRVNGDIASDGAKPDPDPTRIDPIWALVMEKAFCYFHTYTPGAEPCEDTSENSYTSIGGGGWPTEVFTDLHTNFTYIDENSGNYAIGVNETAAEFYALLSSELSNGEPVVLCTPGASSSGTIAGTDIVADHCYTLMGISVGTYDGVSQYLYSIRNPWGTNPDVSGTDGVIQLAFSQIQDVTDPSNASFPEGDNFDGIVLGTP